MHTPVVLYVIADDERFVERVRHSLPGIVAVEAVPSLAAAEGLIGSHLICPAVIAHLTPRVINGFSARELANRLGHLTRIGPIIAALDDSTCDGLDEQVRSVVKEVLPAAFGPQRLLRLLGEVSPLECELLELFRCRPHAVLPGKTRCWVTFEPSVFAMVEELRVAAAHDVTLLLIGETGAGKTFLARTIHEMSPRAGRRFLTVACGALPPDLIESELFGYVKGAFTGANGDKPGKFSAVDDGTLLLDEIDVLPPEHQAKLLRVIETGEYEPVGSNDTRLARARLIVASNFDLQQLVEEGKFRRDLYYRLNMLSFFLPPLRERPADIDYLARKFAIEQARSLGVPLRRIEPAFLAALQSYAWPGNVRELENIIRRAVLYCRDGLLRVTDLPSTMRPASTISEDTLPVQPSLSWTLERRLQEAERHILEEALRRNQYRRQDTAKELGISRITLYHKMKKYGLLGQTREEVVAEVT